MIRQFEYCPLCGAALEERLLEHEEKSRRVCPGCNFVDYQNPTPAAGIVLIDHGRVLLVRRKYQPRVGMWTLPAGFVESGEAVDSCAVREAKEETDLDVEIVRLFNVYSVHDDPRASVILILYLGNRLGGEVRCGDDASDARFFELDRLPKDIAFQAHRDALRDIRRQFGDGGL